MIRPARSLPRADCKIFALGLALAYCAVAARAIAQERPPVVRTEQTAAVRALYPALPLSLDTPALKAGRTLYTTQAELEAYLLLLAAAPKSAAHLARVTLGTTPGGRNLPALLMTREGAKTPNDVMKLGRPVVWLIGQQHGNEPAGGEAMLALARALSDGELTPLLDKLSVVIIPRANPDGAAADTRENGAGFDINRDHGVLTQPEIKLIHDLVRQLPPVLVIDAHEFTVGRRWVEALGGLQSIDLMVLSATHPMVPEPLRKLAGEVFQPAIERAIVPFGLKSFVYHTMSTRTADRTISVGGNAPGIARNAFGLMGAVSFLLETRGVGIGLDSYQRRVATHYIAIRALLETAAAEASTLAATVAAVHAAEAYSEQDIIVAHTSARTSVQLPLIDAATGQPKTVMIDMLDTRVITGTERRARPAGYIVAPERAAVIARRLALMGAKTCTLRGALTTTVERYEILSRTDTDRRAINPDRSVAVRVEAARATLAAGSLYIPLDQPEGTQLALALEPDAPGSLSALELIEREEPPRLAIQRVPRQGVTEEFAGGLVCPKSAP